MKLCLFSRALALALCIALLAQSSAETRTRYSRFRARQLAPEAWTTFQSGDGPEGSCPKPNPVKCPLSGVCCDGFCCPSELPFCTAIICVDKDGLLACGDGQRCSPCVAWTLAVGEGQVCLANSDFPNCPEDPAVASCLTSEGYLECGGSNRTNPKPGYPCGKRCCPLDETCNRKDSSCSKEPPKVTPSPFAIEILSVSPGATPNADGKAPTPTPDVDTLPPTTTTTTTTPSTDTTTTITDTTTTTTTTTITDTTTTTSTTTTVITTTTTTTAAQTTDTSDGDDGVCFPSTATVQRGDGKVVSMQQLRTGDRVRVSTNEYSEVFMWTHRDPAYSGEHYVKLVTRDGQELTATVGHMVPVCRGNSKGCVREIVQIEEIKVGDGVWFVKGDKGGTTAVLRSERIVSSGLYNPQTMHGDLVVDGVVSTCYTRYIPVRIAHSLLMPLRALYEAVYRVFGSKVDFF